MDILKALKGEESKLLKKAQAIRAAIDMLSGNSNPEGNGRRKHHKMSAAAKARIGRATKLRWAKFRAAKRKAGK